MTRLTLGGRTSELDPKIESNLDAFNSRSAQKTLIDPEPGATRLPTEPLPSTRENAPCVSESARYKNDTRPSNAGNPEGSLFPTVPAFRKGLQRQGFPCIHKPLRNGNGESKGAYNTPGLPNVTGDVFSTMANAVVDGASGPFNLKSQENVVVGTNTNLLGYTSVYFSLSNGNTIYGTSTTVMPSSVDVVAAIYLGIPS